MGDAETVGALEALRPDVGVVVAFGQFIPKKVRELPSEGYLINAHASLLPKYRGAAPIARAILDGEAETGISVMRVEKEMDAGAVALVAKTPIGEGENAAELTERLGGIAARAIAEALDRIAHGTVMWTEQDATRATLAAKIEKHDAVLDLRDPAPALAAARVAALVARIHAVSPKPGGAVTLETEGAEPVVLKISRASAQSADGAESAPGTLDMTDTESPLRIATGDGWLVPRVLQRPGGKPLPIADFLRGFDLPEKARLAIVPRPSEDEGGAS